MTSITTEGNTTEDADLRTTTSGTPVAHATLAVTDRTKTTDGEWVDGATTYYEITVWGSPATSFADTAVKGARLIVAGDLTVEEYTDRAGNTRSRRRITADHHGLSSRFHSAACRKLSPSRAPK